MRICFVCTGNICRSPMAAWIFQRMVEDAGLAGRVEVDSAGIEGYHVGQGADPRALATLESRGYRGLHEARQVDAALFDADLIVALDHGHLQGLRRLAPDDGVDRVVLLRSFDPRLAELAAGDEDDPRLDVDDPYYGGREGFERCCDEIETACGGLLAEVRSALEPGSR